MQAQVLSLLALLVQKYKYCWSEVSAARIAAATPNYAGAGPQFAGFTSTKVQILTHWLHLGAEIEGLCRAAASYAFDRNIKVNKGHVTAGGSRCECQACSFAGGSWCQACCVAGVSRCECQVALLLLEYLEEVQYLEEASASVMVLCCY
jgi:hypothetical protein